MPSGHLQGVVRCLWRAAGVSDAQQATDAQLLQRYVVSRDEGAFATLVRRYERLVRSVCQRVLRHEQDIDDAFQVSFMVFAARAATIRRASSVASWLYGVAYRTAMNARRSRARRCEKQQAQHGQAREQPVAEAALREVQTILDEEVQRLAEKRRAPFILSCLQGQSRAEAARQLGWKEGTVSSRLAEAREQLQRRLARRGVVRLAALCALEVCRSTAAASVSPVFLSGTIRGALLFAAGKVVPTSLASAEVMTLAQGALHSMFTTGLRMAAASLLALGLITGTALLTCRAPGDGALVLSCQAQEMGPTAITTTSKRGAASARPTTAPDGTNLHWGFEKGKTFYQVITTRTDQRMKVRGTDIRQKQSQTFCVSWTPRGSSRTATGSSSRRSSG